VDKDHEERRKETHRQRGGSPGGAANEEGQKGDRRAHQVPPAAETPRAPDEATSTREEPFPHEEERPQDGLGRPWWRRIFRGPREEVTERPWWRRVLGG
jgi:hypothetical protein